MRNVTKFIVFVCILLAGVYIVDNFVGTRDFNGSVIAFEISGESTIFSDEEMEAMVEAAISLAVITPQNISSFEGMVSGPSLLNGPEVTLRIKRQGDRFPVKRKFLGNKPGKTDFSILIGNSRLYINQDMGLKKQDHFRHDAIDAIVDLFEVLKNQPNPGQVIADVISVGLKNQEMNATHNIVELVMNSL